MRTGLRNGFLNPNRPRARARTCFLNAAVKVVASETLSREFLIGLVGRRKGEDGHDEARDGVGLAELPRGARTRA
jgi:hypothetical protein